MKTKNKVFSFLKNNKNQSSISEIAKNLKLTRTTVDYHIKSFLRNGIIIQNENKSFEIVGTLQTPFFPQNNYRIPRHPDRTVVGEIMGEMSNIIREVGIGASHNFYCQCLQSNFINENGKHKGVYFNVPIRVSYKDLVETVGTADIMDSHTNLLIKVVVGNVNSEREGQLGNNFRLVRTLYDKALEHGYEHMLIIYITTYDTNPLEYRYYKVVEDPERK